MIKYQMMRRFVLDRINLKGDTHSEQGKTCRLITEKIKPEWISVSAVFFLLAMCLCLIRTISFAASLSDREAKKLVEDDENTAIESISLGEFSVINETPGGARADIKKGTINTRAYELLQAWEKLGLIEIKKDKSLEDLESGKKFSMDAFARRTIGDEAAHIWVNATPKGLEIAKKGGVSQKENEIILPQGTVTVTDLVKNEERKKGVDEYRIIMFKYQRQWNPVILEIRRLVGKTVSKDRKAITLWKYDNFESKWKFVTGDYANQNEEFSTKRVENVIGQ